MSDNVEKIKETLSIIDVAGSYIKIDKAGSNFRARCPFHNEKTPSFFLSPVRNTYHCFGCGRGGDIFNFVQEMEGLDFSGALKILADRAGVELKSFNKEKSGEKDYYYKIIEDATRFFQLNATKEKQVLSYLYGRGLKGETLKNFRVGFIGDGWRNLYDYLKNKGMNDMQIEKTGLVIKSPKGYYDRFRNRIMFPMADSSGRIIAFSGRTFGVEDEKTGKYINSPETEFYHKSEVLYGFDKAKMAIRQQDFCIVVEGQMDLLMSHQAGFENTVAVSGTALGYKHLEKIGRLTNNLIFAFDGDNAGRLAMERASRLALAHSMDVKVLEFKEGNDPADLILESKEKWENLVKNAVNVIDFEMKILREKNNDDRSFKLEVGRKVLPLLAVISNKIEQAHFVDVVAKSLGVTEEVIQEQMENIDISDLTANYESEKIEKKTVFSGDSVHNGRSEIIIQKIQAIAFWQKELDNPEINCEEVLRRLEKIKPPPDLSSDRERELVFQAEVLYQDRTKIKEEIEELLRDLEKEILKEKYSLEISKLREAERKEESELASEILKRCQELSVKISEFE